MFGRSMHEDLHADGAIPVIHLRLLLASTSAATDGLRIVTRRWDHPVVATGNFNYGPTGWEPEEKICLRNRVMGSCSGVVG